MSCCNKLTCFLLLVLCQQAALFSTILSQSIYLSMCVCLQDLLVWLSCRPEQTKNSVSHNIPSRLANGQHDVSLCSGCYVTYLPPYYAGVMQYIFLLFSLPHCEDMRSSAVPAKKDYRLVFCCNVVSCHISLGCVAQWTERRSLVGELTLSCARPAADG